MPFVWTKKPADIIRKAVRRHRYHDFARSGGGLLRTLRSTNRIEDLQRTIPRIVRNVKRWQPIDGRRWCVTALVETEKRFRCVKGYKEMPRLTCESRGDR